MQNSVNLKKIEQHAAQAPALHERIYPLKFSGSPVLKLDKAQRHQYSTFDVGRSMFDVQSVHCSGQMESHTKFHMRCQD